MERISPGVGDLSSKPIVASRTLPWPTRPAMLMPMPLVAMNARYSPYVDQFQSLARADQRAISGACGPPIRVLRAGERLELVDVRGISRLRVVLESADRK